MKLFLTSYRFPASGELFKLVGKKHNDTKFAIIPNAKDYGYTKEERAYKLGEFAKDLLALGVSAEFVDLRKYKDAGKLAVELSGYDVIFACGGNTFSLRYAMHRSGFDSVIKELLDKGKVYGGESAGAICAGTSLQGFESADDAASVPEVINDGLGLLGTVVIPHIDSPDYAEEMKGIISQYTGRRKKPYLLKDNQALVVNGEDIKMVTG